MSLKSKNGFSLLEISVVLLVVSLAVTSGIMVFNKYSAQSKYSQTEYTMRQVMTAIKKYALKYGELPCPADPTISFNSEYYGFSRNPSDCDGAVNLDTGAKRGMVPVSSLNIYPSLANDAWGNRFDYIVVRENTADDALASYNDIPLNLRNYGEGEFSRVVVIVISHGENGFGAYSGRGGTTWKNDDNADSMEQRNSNNNTGGTFYTSTPYMKFDDIVYFWTYDQLTNEDLME